MKTLALRRLPFAFAVFAVVAITAAYWAATGMAGASASFDPKLSPAKRTAKFGAFDTAPYTETAAAKRTTVVAKTKTSKRISSVPGTAATTTSSSSASAPAPASGSSELSQARAILSKKIAQYPILAGTTVEFGDARGYQAISYYRSGRIVISSKHTASLDRIISHEIWHIIDWRDNGRIDWGENIPPK